MSYGVSFVRILEKINCVITTPHCICSSIGRHIYCNRSCRTRLVTAWHNLVACRQSTQSYPFVKIFFWQGHCVWISRSMIKYSDPRWRLKIKTHALHPCPGTGEETWVITYLIFSWTQAGKLAFLLTTSRVVPGMCRYTYKFGNHCNDVIRSAMVTQNTSLTIVNSTVYRVDQRKHQSSASLAFVREIHRWPVISPHKGPVMWKMFPFDYVIMHWTEMNTVNLASFFYMVLVLIARSVSRKMEDSPHDFTITK